MAEGGDLNLKEPATIDGLLAHLPFDIALRRKGVNDPTGIGMLHGQVPFRGLGSRNSAH